MYNANYGNKIYSLSVHMQSMSDVQIWKNSNLMDQCHQILKTIVLNFPVNIDIEYLKAGL